MKLLTLFVISIFFSINVLAQNGRIEGKITDGSTGGKLSGVSILVDSAGAGVISNTEGRFSLLLPPGKKYSITLTSIGYQSKVLEEVEISPNQTASLDIVLLPASRTEAAVVVRSNARRETAAALIAYQKNTSVVAQVISAEAIRRSPDKNTSEVLKRVPGTSVQEGKYLIVRGLADRYNQAMLNGVLLGSTEPDRKTFSFDIFPSAVIDNIIINKAFVPELPGEWAGGLVQVNTKDVPSANFFTVQAGTGFNTNTIGNDFYTYKGSNLDFLGFDNKVRTLPSGFPTKTNFSNDTSTTKLALGKSIASNNWSVDKTNVSPNASFQLTGGFNTKILKKKVAAIFAVNYNKSNNRGEFKNSFFTVNTNNLASPDFVYSTDKYSKDILWGGLANFSLELNSNNRITIKNLFNVNSSNYAALRTGQEFISGTDNIRARELALRTNIFYNTQIAGEHNINIIKVRFNWYGSFNILNQDIPEQRRLQYVQTNGAGDYVAQISEGQSQKSGSVFYSNLSDYIYSAGADIAKSFSLFSNKQTVKGGYFFQVKDRLFDSRPFYIQVFNNDPIKKLPEDQIFDATNFVPGKLGFQEFTGKQFRYLANSILNAGYLQLDNLFTSKIRAVWGVRVEDFDQLVGSVKQSDPRFIHNRVTDFLPALNLTYKLNNKTNIRLSGSQTVIRPEFRELSDFAFYDFELGATVLGNRSLQRTKITNADLRYELYPRAGELFTLGVFYKYFKNPIEVYFNQSGAGSSNTFNFINANKATGYGVEFEMRKKLDFTSVLQNFTFLTNLSYIHNKVTGTSTTKLDRPMQGQSPYVINTGLQYDLEKYALNSTLLFNEIGRRIAYVGNDQTPAIWESPRPILDFQLAKKILKRKGEVKLNVSDIINKEAHFYHDLNDDGKYNKGSDALAIDRKYGTTFSLTFGYNIR